MDLLLNSCFVFMCHILKLSKSDLMMVIYNHYAAILIFVVFPL